jgi:hypothetical protein
MKKLLTKCADWGFIRAGFRTWTALSTISRTLCRRIRLKGIDKLIFQIQNKIRKGEYRLSDHAIKRMIQRSVERLEIEEAVFNGEIIEDYPYDKYAPSCLICGKTNNRPLSKLRFIPCFFNAER